MPLDRINGETIEGLGRGFRVVPVQKWTDTNLWGEAVNKAQKAFHKAGALYPVVIGTDHAICQEYPQDNCLVFLFERQVAGESLYYPVVMTLPDEAIRDLVNCGRWERAN